MKYYVGQIITVDDDHPASTIYEVSVFGMITDRILYHYSPDGKIKIHPLDIKGTHLEIELDDNGEPAAGKWLDIDEAMETFLQTIKDLKKKAKEDKLEEELPAYPLS